MSRAGRIAAVVAVLGAALAACAGPGDAPTDAGSLDHPGGDALVLRVAHVGGFVPYEYHLTSLPSFTLLGDGRVIVPGAQPAIFPGAALPPLLERRLSESGIQALLHEALATGQLDEDAEWRGAGSFVADASDSVFTLNADGREVVVRVYALGIGDGGGGPGVSDEERAAHEALTRLVERLTTLDTWLPAGAWVDADWHPYRGAALRLVVRNADADPPADGGLPLHSEPWPTAGDPVAFGDPTGLDGVRCGVVSGERAEAWNAALENADQLTRWTAGGHRYQVTPRPLLPDEARDCEPLA